MILSQIFSKILRSAKRLPSQTIIVALFSAGLLVGILFLLTSCSTTRHMQLQVAEHIQKDTVFLSNIQYDSIYIDRSSDIDRTRDTITKTMTEYRYKYLRDTVRIVQRDTIPYEVRITEVKEVRYIPPWCKWLSVIGGIAVLILIMRILVKKT